MPNDELSGRVPPSTSPGSPEALKRGQQNVFVCCPQQGLPNHTSHSARATSLRELHRQGTTFSWWNILRAYSQQMSCWCCRLQPTLQQGTLCSPRPPHMAAQSPKASSSVKSSVSTVLTILSGSTHPTAAILCQRLPESKLSLLSRA